MCAFSNTTFTRTSPADTDNACSGADEMRQIRDDVYDRMTVLTKSNDTGMMHDSTAAKDKGFFAEIVSFSAQDTINSAYMSTVPIMATVFKINESSDMVYDFSFYGQEATGSIGFGPNLVSFIRNNTGVAGALNMIYFSTGEDGSRFYRAAEQGLAAGTYSVGFYTTASVPSDEALTAYHKTLRVTRVLLDNFG